MADLTVTFRSKLVGREKELSELKSLLQATFDGAGKLVLIEGEIGIGKTRLMREFGNFAKTKGAKFLYGKCSPNDTEPFSAFLEPLRYYFKVTKEMREDELSQLKTILSDRHPELLDRMDVLTNFLTSGVLDGKSATNDERMLGKERMFETIYQLIDNISNATPLVLFLDDMHLADESTVNLMQYIARGAVESRVMLCVAYRSEELSERRELGRGRAKKMDVPLAVGITRMSRERLFSKLSIGRLDKKAVNEMVSGIFGKPINGKFVDLLYEETKGNPFFIEEVIKSLVEEGKIDIEDEDWDTAANISAIEIPDSIRSTIEMRLERLGETDLSVMWNAAVISSEFRFSTLASVVDLDEEELVASLDRLLAAKLIIEETEKDEYYSFHHPKIRDVTYDMIPSEKRAQIHRSVGEALEKARTDKGRLKDVAFELAYHFYHGSVPEKAVYYLCSAGQMSINTYALDEAINYYSLALDVLEKGYADSTDSAVLQAANMRRKEITDKLSNLYTMVGEWDKALEALAKLEEFSKADDPEKHSEALRCMAHIYSCRNAFDKAVEHYHSALELSTKIGDKMGIAHANRGIGQVFWRQGKYSKSIDCYRACIAEAKQLSDKKIIPTVCIDLGNVYNTKGNFIDAIDYYSRAIEMLEKDDISPPELARAYSNIGDVFERQGEWKKAIESYKKGIEICKKCGAFRTMAYCVLNLSSVLVKFAEATGDTSHIEKSEQYCVMAQEFFRKLDEKLAIAVTKSIMGMIFKAKKEYERSAALFEDAIFSLEELSIPFDVGEAYYEYGMMLQKKGDSDGARAKFDKALAIFERLGATTYIEKVRLARDRQ